MTTSRLRILAWAGWVLSIVALVVAVAYLVVAWGTPDPPEAFGPAALAPSLTLAVGTVGLIIALRRPGNPIGWIFLGCAVLSGAQAVGTAYARWALIAHEGVPRGGEWGAWVEEWVWIPIAAALGFAASIFPDGRFLSRRWRWWMSGLTAATLIPTVLSATIPRLSVYAIDNPVGVGSDAVTQASDIAPVILLLQLAAGAAAATSRFRRSVGEERQQLKWLTFSTAMLATALVIFAIVAIPFAGTSSTPEGADWAENLVVVAFVAVPVSIGLGVLKYRLYDIDVVINRALVYGVLAAFISAVYVGVVVGVGALIGSRGNAALSALAAAVVALAFQPVRRRAQHIANRLVYGKRATPYEVFPSCRAGSRQRTH